MISYKLTNNDSVLRIDSENGKVWSIPLNATNWMAQEYREWLAQGNTPEPADD